MVMQAGLALFGQSLSEARDSEQKLASSVVLR